MFEAVYIADSKNNLVYEYLINLTLPGFKSVVNVVSQHDDDLPLIHINQDHFVAFEKTTNLIIYLLCDNTIQLNPAMPFVFIQRLLEVMADYFGAPLALTKIEANTDTLTLLINEMIDNGIPNTTDFNRLRDLVPYRSLLGKFLSTSNDLAAAGKKTITSLNGKQALSPNKEESSVPWRRSNVKHTYNEMYVDVIETINVILKPSASKKALTSSYYDSAFYSAQTSSSTQLVPITGTIDGRVNFLSHISGVPLLQLVLALNGNPMDLPEFHQCINLEKWHFSPGTLSFIPADGHSTLMTYLIDLDDARKKYQQDLLGLVNIDYQSGLGTHQNEFEIRISFRNQKGISKVEGLSVEVVCEEKDEAEESDIVNIRANRITHGDFVYKSKGRGEWNLRDVNSSINPVLHGTIVNGDEEEDLIEVKDKTTRAIKPIYIKLNYTHKGTVPSGIKVDSLKIISAKGLGDTIKPYKGVKYITKTGEYIVRS